MGAHNIEACLKGHVNERQLAQWLGRQQRADRDYNGHQDGYSGDWQTIHAIEIVDHDFTGSESEASDYCLDRAEKWSSAAAVHMKNEAGDPVTYIAGWAAS